ncbi:MAG: hypothetical protein ACFHWX_09865 [Bacteroidota bacterium]
MPLNISQRIKLRVTTQIIGVGVILGLIYVAFSNGFSSLYPFINGGVIGLLLGSLIAYMELWVFTTGSRKMRFITLLSLRTIIYTTLIATVIFLTTAISRMVRFDHSFSQVMQSEEFQTYILHGNFSVAILYSLLFAFSINFTRMISRKMGQGMLVSFITGTFYQPLVQNRIIMFLGIKNVNEFSDRLNEFDFFDFLNDFFFDITTPIVLHQGIIYEYVEDQIVITWRPEKGIFQANCIRAFFAVVYKLETRKEYYYERYGMIPDTFASIHNGKLVRSEIGKIKTQIVFHGDAMNTTARLLSKCKELGKQLIVSKELMSKIDLPLLYYSEDLGYFNLKGKLDKIGILSIEEKNLTTI